MARGTKENKPKKNEGSRPMIVRCAIVAVAFTVAAAALCVRLGTLQLEEKDQWQALASKQQLANVTIEPERGTIYDSNMKAMAQSATVWTVEAAPNVLAASYPREEGADNKAARVAAKELAAILDLDEGELFEALEDDEVMYYKVKAKIDKPEADAVREMVREQELSGIYLKQDSKRYYPYEELASTVLGFTNADGDGIEGLESQYDEVLAGTPGRQVAVQNAWGGEVAGEEDANYPAEDGNSIVLTVDTDIQQAAEKYLSKAVEEHKAHERGMCVVMNVNTGAILAMATSPAYNPNDPYYIFDEETRTAIEAMPEGDEKSQAQSDARILQWRNKALADTYEPGSVFKVITASAGLDSGIYNENSTFYCSSSIAVGEKDEFGCALDTAHGQVSLRKALIESCNVSFVQIGQELGVQKWYSYLNGFGLTEPTGVDLPGEPSLNSISSLVYSEENMGPVELASCSFGQSNKYTALQMITAVSAAVNGGNLVQPHIVKEIRDSEGSLVESINPEPKRQVISPETSATICSALEELVADTPNGQNAYVAGYHVGGKSGTSEKLERRNQDGEDVYISSFLGFAPANDPEIAVLVVLDEPEDPTMGNYFGGRLAGPTAGNIIKETLQILGVESDYEEDAEISRSTKNCPKLEEETLVDAQTALNKQNLSAMVVGSGDTVVAQSPAPYTQVPTGGQVILYTDPEVTEETLQVPDLCNQRASTVIEQAKAMGLNILTTGAPLGGPNVQVVQQDIEAGTEVPKGTTITLTLQDTSAVSDH